MSIEQKQQYLRENIMEVGYDPVDFEQYWTHLGKDFDTITHQELQEITLDFKSKYSPIVKDDEEDFTDFQSSDPEMMKIDWGFLEGKKSQLPHESVIKSQEKPRKMNQCSKNPQSSKLAKQKVEQGLLEFDEPFVKINSKSQSNSESIENSNNFGSFKGGNIDNSISIRQVYDKSTTQTHSCLKLQPNILDHHNNVIFELERVIEEQPASEEDSSKREKGFISKLWEGAKTTIGLNELPMHVKTTGRNKSKAIGVSWKVLRKRNDFEWLHKMLIKFYPGTVVPPLPGIARSEEKVFGYIKKLQAFLTDIYRCRELRNSKYFETFLSYGNRKDFQAFIKNAESISEPSSLGHVLNMQGEINLYFGQKINEYSANLQAYLSKESLHLKEVKTITGQIISGYESLSLNFRNLGNIFDKMAQETDTFSLVKDRSPEEECFTLLTQTYSQIASLMDKHSEFCLEQRDSVETFMYSHFSYEKDRLENIQNLLQKRSVFSDAFAKLEVESASKQQSKSMFGLNTPSGNLETLKKQLGFYNSQVLRQSCRCTDVMIQSYVNHFSNYGHTRVDNVDSMQQVWSKVMVEFSKIKVA